MVEMRIATAFLGDASAPAAGSGGALHRGRSLMAIASAEVRARRIEAGEAPSLRRILALGGHDFTSRPPDRAVCELILRLATERAGGGRGSAFCRPPAAIPPSRSPASTRPLVSGPATPLISRSSGSAATRWLCAITSSPRT